MKYRAKCDFWTKLLTKANYEPLQTGPLVVQQNGYVTVYVGNESAADVYFDDVRVEHRQGLQVQENQYDPTGLELAGLTRDTPGLKPLNQYRWNGKEFQGDLGLNWTQLDWRMFDAQLNRLPGVDPEIETGQENMSPYAFGFDNAVRNNDPNGRCPGGICPPNPLHRTGNAASQPDLITALQEPLNNMVTSVVNTFYEGLVAIERFNNSQKGSGDLREYGQMMVGKKGNGVSEPSLAIHVKKLNSESLKSVLEMFDTLSLIKSYDYPSAVVKNTEGRSVEDVTNATADAVGARNEAKERRNSGNESRASQGRLIRSDTTAPGASTSGANGKQFRVIYQTHVKGNDTVNSHTIIPVQ